MNAFLYKVGMYIWNEPSRTKMTAADSCRNDAYAVYRAASSCGADAGHISVDSCGADAGHISVGSCGADAAHISVGSCGADTGPRSSGHFTLLPGECAIWNYYRSSL